MKVYSKTIEMFLPRLRKWAREILRNEFNLKVARTRFHMDNGYTYPISIVVIDDQKQLGYFDPAQLVIGINRSLLYQAKERVIKDILRHELAHYLTFIFYSANYHQLETHGREFKGVCEHFHLDPAIAKATIDLREENERIEGDLTSERVIAKVQKLIALSKSNNQSEAELATIKANQLMLQHNIDRLTMTSLNSDEEIYYVKLVLPGKRDTPRRAAISQILTHFFVVPVRCQDGLEITGTKANVENAEYIALFLDQELRRLFLAARKEHPSLREKPFMIALVDSFCWKLKQALQGESVTHRKALMVLEQQLMDAVGGVYGRTTYKTSTYTHCQQAETLGREAGSNLHIRRGVGGADRTKLLE